ncbi:MAG TPA: hypothetical protein VNA89_15690, partial [Gemmatimonadaceae bacterium]|nr:hypothetical protein [Gemmatimonadaceae bacterium]
MLVDSTGDGDRLEALALPADPTPLLRAAGQSPRGDRAADQLRRWEAARDSAGEATERFARLRDSLVAEARALDGQDRRTPAYAARFDAYRRRAADATALRAQRDRLRRRAE